MSSMETGATGAGMGSGMAWLSDERLAWLVVACLLGALLLVRSSIVPDRAMLFANPLAFGLFVAFYRLIRIREGDGHS